MKSLKRYIDEKLIVNKNYADPYNYHPKDKKELKVIIKEHYNNGIYDLNDIDVSEIDDFSGTFSYDKNTGHKDFNISKWDVSNGKYFSGMFSNCEEFNSNISNWNVGNGEDFDAMFSSCRKFNSNLSKWDVSNGKDFSNMFLSCKEFNCNLGKWNVSNGINFNSMFYGCAKLNCDLSEWTVSKGKNFYYMFFDCDIDKKNKPKRLQ